MSKMLKVHMEHPIHNCRMDNGGYSMIKIRHQRQWRFQNSESEGEEDDDDLTTPSDVCARLHSNYPRPDYQLRPSRSSKSWVSS